MEKIRVYSPGVKDKFQEWIASRGGVTVWRNQDLGNPAAGEMFTPAETEGRPTNAPHWAYGEPEVVKELDRFLFAKELKETARFHVAVERQGGLKFNLTQASKKKLFRALGKAGPEAAYVFDYATQEAVILVPVWEEP